MLPLSSLAAAFLGLIGFGLCALAFPKFTLALMLTGMAVIAYHAVISPRDEVTDRGVSNP